jgi:hypothetical protein
VPADPERTQGIGDRDHHWRPQVAGSGDQIMVDGQPGGRLLAFPGDLDPQQVQEVVDVVGRGHLGTIPALARRPPTPRRFLPEGTCETLQAS